jgi:uncharacterized membrane protein
VARRFILSASMPLGVLAFWVCMSIAAVRFPSQYDWRYMTTSVLLYPERNPAGHWWASAALMACASAGLIWVWALRETRRSPGRYVLAAGYLCMILSSSLPERWLSIRNGHEILAIAGFVGMCSGLVLVSLHYLSTERHQSRVLPVLLAAVAFLPVLITGITQAYLSWWRPDLPWVGLAWKTIGVPLPLSFALWEWVTCAVLSAYMTGIGFAVGDQAWKTSNC